MSEDNSEPLPEGTLISHLLELRSRLLKAFIAVIIAFCPAWYYCNQIFDFISQPLVAKLPPGQKLIAGAGELDAIAPACLESGLQGERAGEGHVLFQRAGHARGPRIAAAMARIEDHQRRLARCHAIGRCGERRNFIQPTEERAKNRAASGHSAQQKTTGHRHGSC